VAEAGNKANLPFYGFYLLKRAFSLLEL